MGSGREEIHHGIQKISHIGNRWQGILVSLNNNQLHLFAVVINWLLSLFVFLPDLGRPPNFVFQVFDKQPFFNHLPLHLVQFTIVAI